MEKVLFKLEIKVNCRLHCWRLNNTLNLPNGGVFSWSSGCECWLYKYTFDQHFILWEDAKRGENRTDRAEDGGGWEIGMSWWGTKQCPLATPHWMQMSTSCDKFNQKVLYLSPEEEKWSSYHKKTANIKGKYEKQHNFVSQKYVFSAQIYLSSLVGLQPKGWIPLPYRGDSNDSTVHHKK